MLHSNKLQQSCSRITYDLSGNRVVMIRFISISLCVNILVTGSSEVRIPLKCHNAARLPQQAKALDCVCRCRYRTQDSGILDGREKPCGKREMCSAFADRMACGHGSSVAPPTKTTLLADRFFFFFLHSMLLGMRGDSRRGGGSDSRPAFPTALHRGFRWFWRLCDPVR